MTEGALKDFLENLYHKLNHRRFVHPDPLEFLYLYPDPRDREIVGLVASTLAYGRVKQIHKSISYVLERMSSPWLFLKNATLNSLMQEFDGFKHRFTTGEDIAYLLVGAKNLIENYGSLEGCFLSCFKSSDENVVNALSGFVFLMRKYSGNSLKHVIPDPVNGSACKRLNLYLRWMVRQDSVDPGGWNSLSPSKLVVPLDTHMHNIAQALGITGRRQASLKTALEITETFKKMIPDDPVRYDFALTRLGIREDLSMDNLLTGKF